MDNLDHFSRQQTVTTFSDTASVSSQHSKRKTTLIKPVVTMEDLKRREVETAYITRIGGTVDTLARHYSPDRYPDIDVSQIQQDCLAVSL